ncbi:spore coat protein [Paenibacillus sp. SC116]|uniref:spore coat protein n=1 Tax=Paenibacillus sp. SC116 TaxID=2968986 RepID=UPI00215ADB15|nr:spore coat protein [Paenibacillus sp. SC116]MCR8844420.1 spore coat protein [Paenibacillus sp. SC116]
MRFITRWLRMLAAFIVISVITSLLTIGTTALVVDQYLQTTIQQFQLPIDKKPLTVMSLWGSLWNGAKSEQQVDRIDTRETAQQSEQSHNGRETQQGAQRDQNTGQKSTNGTGRPDTSGTNGASNNDNRGNSDEVGTNGGRSSTEGSTSPGQNRKSGNSPEQEGATSDAALPVWSGNINESSQSGNRVLVTPEEIVEGKDKLTEQTKEKLFSTLMKKLPADDWQRISVLMEEGLTAAELIEMEQILAKHLNDEEYKQMREILTGSSKPIQQAQANENSTNNREAAE